jgi:excisionase family DNA binding protein
LYGARQGTGNIEASTAAEGKPWSLIAHIQSYRRLMTINDVAEVLGSSTTTIYRMAQCRQIPSLMIGGARSSTQPHQPWVSHAQRFEVHRHELPLTIDCEILL